MIKKQPKKLTKKLKPIQPQYLYDKNGKVKMVYLTIDDYNRFMTKLRKFSEAARKREEKQKATQQ